MLASEGCTIPVGANRVDDKIAACTGRILHHSSSDPLSVAQLMGIRGHLYDVKGDLDLAIADLSKSIKT